MRSVGCLLILVVGALCAGCHGDVGSEEIHGVVRLTPRSVSSPELWQLFDRSVASGFVPGGEPQRVMLERPAAISLIKVHGASPYRLTITGDDDRALGFSEIDLSTVGPGWHVFASTAPATTGGVQLRFERFGAAGGAVSELELWTLEGGTAPRPPELVATPSSATLQPGACAAFAIASPSPGTVFARAHLAFELDGAIRAFALRRTINGLAEQGGASLSGAAGSRAVDEPIDPGVIRPGANEVRLCLPAATTQPATIANLRIIGEPDRGTPAETAEIGRDHRVATALLDDDPATVAAIAAGEPLTIGFARLEALDAVALAGTLSDDAVAEARCLQRDGAATVLDADAHAIGRGIVLDLHGGAQRCAQLELTFRTAVALAGVRVTGSGAAEPVDWPHIVVTSAPEHFGAIGWVGGFVARPAAMRGAVRTTVADQPIDALTGDFGRLITREVDDPAAWPVVVTAALPDGTTERARIVLQRAPATTVGAPGANAARAATAAGAGSAPIVSNTETTVDGDLESIVQVAVPSTATTIQLGTGAAVTIPAAAVSRPTTITLRDLGVDLLPPLDPGMINVTAPSGHGVEFLPHGQVFARSVDVVLPFDASLIPDGMTADDVHTFFYDPVDERWTQLARTAINLDTHVTHSESKHFTVMIDAVLAVPKNPAPLSFDPTTLGSIGAASPAASIDLIGAPEANSAGDARTMLPIRVPRGRGGYTPSLSIAYSSGGGNGWLGVGWDLAVSKIEIDTRWGAATYRDGDSVRYLLDGGELVPSGEAAEGPTCAGAQRYHARIEGGFAHILRCGNDPTDYHWEVHDREGTLFVFGSNDAAVGPPTAASYTGPQGIFRWNLGRVVDVHGNTTTFHYAADEITDTAEPSRDVYPSSIHYTQHASLPDEQYTVEFVLDDGARPDRIVSGRSGWKMVTRRLLRSVRVAFRGQVIREYVLTYSHGQFDKSLLASIRQYGVGGCTAGGDAFTPPACGGASLLDEHGFDYFRDDQGFAQVQPWDVAGDPDPANATLGKGATSDVSGGAGVSIGDKEEGARLGVSGSSGDRTELVGLYDMNGDGLPDQVFRTGNGIEVLYNHARPDLDPTSEPLFAPGTAAITGLSALGADRSGSWGISLSGNVEVAQASVGFSSSTARGRQFLTDLDGDGYLDLVRGDGTALLGQPCATGMCFAPVAFGAPTGIDPRSDALLQKLEHDIKARLSLGDPVVQWVAPFSGTIAITGSAQKLHPGGSDGVTIEAYHQDTLIQGQSIAPGETDAFTFPTETTRAVVAGEAIYLRVKTGADDAIAPNGTEQDLIDARLQIRYTHACTDAGCGDIADPLAARDPLHAPIFAFDSHDDFRIAGAPTPLIVAAGGTLELHGVLTKRPSLADLRVCVQQFSAGELASRTLDRPCSAHDGDVANVSGTFALPAGSVAGQAIDLSLIVDAGQLVMVRVESDLSFDPADVALVAGADRPLAAYSQVCLPSISGGGFDCSTDPKVIAGVPLSLAGFGPFVPISAEPPAVPLVAPHAGVLQVASLVAPSEPFLFAIRSDVQGILWLVDCTASSCGPSIDVAPLSVGAGESLTFELVTQGGSGAAPIDVFLDDPLAPLAAVLERRSLSPPRSATPFAGGFRRFHAGFWTESIAFEPARLLADLAFPLLLDTDRKKQIARSITPAQASFGGSPISGGAPAWIAPASAAFVAADGLNAAYIGLLQGAGTPADVGGLFAGSYVRLSGTTSFYVTGGATLGIDGFDFHVDASASSTDTTTDLLDMNGDGIGDVVTTGHTTLGALSGAAAGGGTASFAAGDALRHRSGHEYSVGFGGKAVQRRTSSAGRTLDVDNPDGPDQGTFGLSDGRGLAIGRTQVTKDLIDINGDGLPDLVSRDGAQISVQLNLGDRFGKPEPFGVLDAALRDAQDDFESSVEHGALSSLLDSTSDALHHETTITTNESGGFDFGIVNCSHSSKHTSSRITRQIADINGDGLPDVLYKRHGENRIRVQLNRGGDLGPATEWATDDGWPINLDASLSDVSSSLLDKLGNLAVTGPDVLAGAGSQDSTSNGCGVSIPIMDIVTIDFGLALGNDHDTYELSLLDIDGDGAADHVLRRGRNGNPDKLFVKHNLISGRANLLRTVHRPLGGTVTLDYQQIARSVDVPHRREVLTRVEVDDGVDLGADFASPNLVTTIDYDGGFYDRNEKEFFGFHRVTSTRADGTTFETVFDTASYALHGRVLSETRRDAAGHALRRHAMSYAVTPVLASDLGEVTAQPACLAHLHPLLARATGACAPSFPAIVQDDTTRSEDGATQKTRTVTEPDRDRFGNVLVSIDGGDDALASDDRHEQLSYRNDTDRWILGRVSSLVVRAGGAGGAILRSRSAAYSDLGDLTTLNVATGGGVATTTLDYDAFGNLTSITTPPNTGGQSQTFAVAYDPDVAIYAASSQDGFGLRSTAEYDVRFGVATREVDQNGQQLTRTLDDFGRVTAVRGPYDTATSGVAMEYHPDESPPRAVTILRAAAPADFTGAIPAPVTTVSISDGLGQTIEQRKTAVVDGVAGMTTSSVAKRDAVGRAIGSYNPFFTPGASTSFAAPQLTLMTGRSYDALDRPLSTQYADGAQETAAYDIAASPDGVTLFRQRTIDANGNPRETFLDAAGQTRAFVEHPAAASSSVARYDYSAVGELVHITDAEGAETQLGYDLRGLRTSLANPDTGLVEERFDLMGNRVARIEPNQRALGVEVRYVYDRDRLIKIDYPSKPDVTIAYGAPGAPDGGAGRVVSITDETGTQQHRYGALGELRRTIRSVVSGNRSFTFDLRMTFDSLDRQLQVAYPDGEVVTNAYDAAGMLTAVSATGTGWSRTYADDIRYDVFGNRSHARYGNGAESSWVVDPARIRMSSITTTLPSFGKIQDLHYSYDASGNPTHIDNNLAPLDGGSGTMPGVSNLTLSYDGVDRLTRAVGSAQLDAQKTTAYDQHVSYSASHNLLHKDRVHTITNKGGVSTTPVATNFSSDYTYGGARPHLPLQIGDLAMSYDASGNPVTRTKVGTGSVQHLVWDDDDRLVDYTRGGVHEINSFDIAGNRVVRKSIQSETIFSSQYFDLENGTQGVKHVFAGSMRVASELTRFSSGTDPVAPSKPGRAYFFHADHLQSTHVVTDDDGKIQESLEYFSDGEQWIDRGPNKPINGYLFSGKPFDPDTGFYDFGQRFYEPRTSLWLGIDPKLRTMPASTVGRPAMLATLGYVDNNPLRFSDLDGRDKDRARLVIVDYDKGLSDKQLQFVVGQVKTSLDATTASATDKRLKKDGVDVRSQRGIAGVEDLRKRGTIIVYLLHNIGDDKHRASVVTDILKAENSPIVQRRLESLVQSVTADLRETINKRTGEASGQSEYSPAVGVSFVNLDLISKRDEGNLRAIAGDVLHEGPGHRGLDTGYHNKDDKGVMSKSVRESATPEEIRFDKSEGAKVNEFLSRTINEPGWNRDPGD